MKVRWLGHSCFKLEESTGDTVLTDPYFSNVDESEKNKLLNSNVITLSKKNLAKTLPNNISKETQIISDVGFWECKGVNITSFITNLSKKEDENYAYIYRLDGVNVCHLGSVKVEETLQLIETIGYVNILIIPIAGGKHSIDAIKAKDYVDVLMPDIVIPMQFREKGFDLDRLDEFEDLFEKDDIMYVDGNEIEFDRADFDGDTTKLLIFKNN